jgi:hypothetical protein
MLSWDWEIVRLGHRGILHGQPVGDTGAPIAYFDVLGIPPTLNPVPFTFAFDLNTGKVYMNGAFPGLPANLEFRVEYLKEFDGAGGKNIVFTSDKTSDNAGYVIALQLVGAS